MVGNRRTSEARHDGLLDAAGLALIALAALVCAVSALAGLSPAGRVLPFLVGALIGDGLVYLAIRTRRYRKALVVLAIFVVVASLVLSFNLFVDWSTGLPVRLPWEIPDVVEKLCAGVLLGFGGYVLSLIVNPAFDGPRSWKEAVEQRRKLVRGTLIAGGILLALVVLGGLVFGFLALVAYAVGSFSG